MDSGVACHLIGQDAHRLGQPGGAAGPLVENFVIDLADGLTNSCGAVHAPVTMNHAFQVRDDGAVKRSTAIRHLVELGEVASERMSLRATDVGWPLEELWVAGELLGFAESLEFGSVTIVLDVPADELPWLTLHPAGEWVGSQLGLGKRPMGWSYRPLAWPVWNHEHRRLARFWSATDGTDGDVIEALRSRRLEGLVVNEPSAEQLERQLSVEVAVSRRHLRTILDRYWDLDWRREHGRHDESPEDHLWRAASAVSEMQDALDELRG